MRSTFSSSRLIRRLGAWAPVAAPAPGMDFAEQLSLWLNAFDAIALQSTRPSVRAAAPAGRPAEQPSQARALGRAVQAVRDRLATAIAQDVATDVHGITLAGHPRLAQALGERAAKADAQPSYAPFQHRHQELQRLMELAIGPLREQARQVLSRAGGPLRQLAALDAVMEQVLSRRGQVLLPTAVRLLEQRFLQLRPQSAAANDTAWLDTFTAEWRETLLAELDLRLEAVAGLQDALDEALEDAAPQAPKDEPDFSL